MLFVGRIGIEFRNKLETVRIDEAVFRKCGARDLFDQSFE